MRVWNTKSMTSLREKVNMLIVYSVYQWILEPCSKWHTNLWPESKQIHHLIMSGLLMRLIILTWNIIWFIWNVNFLFCREWNGLEVAWCCKEPYWDSDFNVSNLCSVSFFLLFLKTLELYYDYGYPPFLVYMDAIEGNYPDFLWLNPYICYSIAYEWIV